MSEVVSEIKLRFTMHGVNGQMTPEEIREQNTIIRGMVDRHIRDMHNELRNHHDWGMWYVIEQVDGGYQEVHRFLKERHEECT